MKKLISLLLAAVMLVIVFSACSDKTDAALEGEKPALSVVATVFPQYDWTREILGDNPAGAKLTLLLDDGVDLHSCQPTVEDMAKIVECDVFIYVGGESDEWVADALNEADTSDMTVINLMDALGEGARDEEIVEGMQAEEEEGEEGEEGEEETEYDEHIWLSLKNAALLCDSICAGLCEADPDHADIYRANTEAYTERLRALDGEYEAAVGAAPVKTLLFGDRFPFRYLTDDYGIEYFAAFVGCSAETEASFETVTFLSEKVDELGLSHIMVIESSDKRIAETIRDNTASKDQTILTLDSMQSAGARETENGATYIGIMEDNLNILKEALT
ncbi:MAG: zinc ABC transporter substrate-binding protein [Clostridia bacterium]|nr:zinc ABC transporter substrate-binding protein [Clostridia bacterium]